MRWASEPRVRTLFGHAAQVGLRESSALGLVPNELCLAFAGAEMNTKKRTISHITEQESYRQLLSLVPEHWVVRTYGPDYGIDVVVELFGGVDSEPGVYSTLGEHVFIQLKGQRSLEFAEVTIPLTYNPEKPTHGPTRTLFGGDHSVCVVRFRLETSELATAQRMGAAVPLLLVLVETTTGRVFYLCLNDYIDKYLLALEPDALEQNTKTLYIPLDNEITDPAEAVNVFRMYAKRPKLYGLFQKASYQRLELDYVWADQILSTCRHFSQTLLASDVWDLQDVWPFLGWLREDLQGVREGTGPKHSVRVGAGDFSVADGSEADADEAAVREELLRGHEDFLFRTAHITLWDSLNALGGTFEEICRNWGLPTDMRYDSWARRFGPI